MALRHVRIAAVTIASAAWLAACGSSHTAGGDGGGAGDGGPAVDSGTPVDSGPGVDAGAAVDAGGGDCAALTEAECVGSRDCAPLYDDYCCPSCMPVGFCADCSRIQMYRCVPIEETCGGTPPCTVAGTPPCGEIPSCADAVPTSDSRCSVPGCVARIEADCREGCLVECVPVTGDSCTALCDSLPPDCPDGQVPETADGCYTGYCIAASACEPAASLGG